MVSCLTRFEITFHRREDGPTAVEHAAMPALIIVVCLTAITTLAANANSALTAIGKKSGSASS
jgi:pilus assembly protein Flp/PilA